jgi:dienelactone hydrolase
MSIRIVPDRYAVVVTAPQPADPTVGSRWSVLLAGDGAREVHFQGALSEALAPLGGEVVPIERHDTVAAVAVDDATPALDAAAASNRVASVVAVDARVPPDSLELIGELTGTALLTVVDPARRDRIVSAIDGHLASLHPDSDVVVEAPDDGARAQVIARWLERRVAATTSVDELTLHTPDGWILGADLHRPAGTAPGTGWPAVVLMHTGRSDRTVFDRLARLLARHGVVALALDWRGRGTSTNLGHFVDFTKEQQASVRVDVTTAYDHLASRGVVDASRLGVLGIAHGAGYAADGALTDERTRAIAMMTAYHLPDSEQRAALASGRIAAMFVTCEPHVATTRAMRELFDITTARGSRFVTYPEGVLGYQLFDLHPDLEPSIAGWFAEVLA